jgi:hypothetical protein
MPPRSGRTCCWSATQRKVAAVDAGGALQLLARARDNVAQLTDRQQRAVWGYHVQTITAYRDRHRITSDHPIPDTDRPNDDVAAVLEAISSARHLATPPPTLDLPRRGLTPPQRGLGPSL